MINQPNLKLLNSLMILGFCSLVSACSRDNLSELGTSFYGNENNLNSGQNQNQNQNQSQNNTPPSSDIVYGATTISDCGNGGSSAFSGDSIWVETHASQFALKIRDAQNCVMTTTLRPTGGNSYVADTQTAVGSCPSTLTPVTSTIQILADGSANLSDRFVFQIGGACLHMTRSTSN